MLGIKSHQSETKRKKYTTHLFLSTSAGIHLKKEVIERERRKSNVCIEIVIRQIICKKKVCNYFVIQTHTHTHDLFENKLFMLNILRHMHI